MDLMNSLILDFFYINNILMVQENMGLFGLYGIDEYSVIIVVFFIVVIVFGVLGNLVVIGMLF